MLEMTTEEWVIADNNHLESWRAHIGGILAYYAGQPLDDNPYPEFNIYHKQWHNGWCETYNEALEKGTHTFEYVTKRGTHGTNDTFRICKANG